MENKQIIEHLQQQLVETKAELRFVRENGAQAHWPPGKNWAWYAEMLRKEALVGLSSNDRTTGPSTRLSGFESP